MATILKYPYAYLTGAHGHKTPVWASDANLLPSSKAQYRCSQDHPMKLRRGKQRQWHFSHYEQHPGCLGESPTHQHIKAMLAQHWEDTLYGQVQIEKTQPGRRADIQLNVWDTTMTERSITVEIQHSSIDIDILKRRVALDIQHGDIPCWIFTWGVVNLPKELRHGMDLFDVALPNSLSWLLNSWGIGLTVVDKHGALWHLFRNKQLPQNKYSTGPKHYNFRVSAAAPSLQVTRARSMILTKQGPWVALLKPAEPFGLLRDRIAKGTLLDIESRPASAHSSLAI